MGWKEMRALRRFESSEAVVIETDLPALEDQLHRAVSTRLEQDGGVANFGAGEVEHDALAQLTRRVLEAERRILPQEMQIQLIEAVVNRILGFGPLEPYLHDPSVSEIMVNAPDEVFVERDGRLERVSISFRDARHVLQVIDRIISPLGRRLDEALPYVDARLPDGSRVNAIIPPLALRGPALTIRRFSPVAFTLDRLVELGTLSQDMASFLEACVQARLSMVISGGTGSGKTSTLNALSRCIPVWERLVTIEDTAELQLARANLVCLEARPPNIEGRGEVSIRTLVRNALRMRPDRILVGEVRGPEAFDMLQAMNTGHPGSITTIHANSPQDALHRLESMVLMANLELPQPAIREQVAGAVRIVLQQDRFADGSRKIVSIAEVVGESRADRWEVKVETHEVFRLERGAANWRGGTSDHFAATGYVPGCLRDIEAASEHHKRVDTQ